MASGTGWRGYALRRGIAIVALVAALGAAIGAIAGATKTKEYTATAEVTLSPQPVRAAPSARRRDRGATIGVVPRGKPYTDPDQDGVSFGPNARDARPGARGRTRGAGAASRGGGAKQAARIPRDRVDDYAAIIDDSSVTGGVVDRLRLSDPPASLRPDLAAKATGDDVIAVEATRDSKREASRTANAAAGAFADFLPRRAQGAGSAPIDVEVTTLASAGSASSGSGTGTGGKLVAGLVVGILLGIVLALVLNALSQLEARRARKEVAAPE